MARIALIATGEGVARRVQSALAVDGHQVALVNMGDGFCDRVRTTEPELVLYKCDASRESFGDSLAELRDAVDVPVVVLGESYSEQAAADLLNLGADACLFAPYGAAELCARIKACLRRYWVWGPGDAQNVVASPVVNEENRSVVITGKEIKLTPSEYRLLARLMENAGQVVSRDDLCDHVWGVEAEDMAQTNLNLCIYNLRQKLEKDPHHPEYVRTKWGFGYFLGAKFNRLQEG